ncbi:MAG: hypothetical protein EX271_00125 [Acidimicrobiales bacterium]|nr:hypothetical protein [Hyphomonadaceae bacterium]RZV45095.1 MAG: hypothetical protein EX271_00125 [Acidimicrobiales bacterium]
MKLNKLSLFKGAAVIAICILSSAASTPTAFAADKSFVGAWEVNVSPDGFPFTIPTNSTVTSDNTIISADPTFGSGHGVWEKVGNNKFAVSFTHIFNASLSPCSADAGPFEELTVNGVVTVDSTGETASGPFLTVYKELSGTILCAFGGDVSMTRYNVDYDIISTLDE